jgi:zinc-ribbon domain
MNVFPIQAPPEEAGQAKCPNCGTPVVADQRYCLACGQPCSPVRLAFLDVLQAESELRGTVSVISPPAGYAPPVGYLPPAREDGAIGWLRRYSGLFGLLAVLLMTGLIGLLVGHWISPSKAAGPQVVKIEGAALPAAAAGSAVTGTSMPASPAPAPKTSTTSSASTEAQEKKEVKEAAKAKPPPPVKTSSSSLKKLEKLTGKKHQQAIESLTAGGKPIETGG